MCVICYIPKEAENLSKKDLLAMWRANSDGAGMMWINDTNKRNHKVYFSKGYMTFDSFYKDYLIVKEDNNFECALHFRISTSGGVNQKLCHPFPLTKNEKYIVKTKGVADVCIMHNGIIPISNRPQFNDTVEYILQSLYPRYRSDKRFFNHLSVENEINSEINGSRLLFFSTNGIKMVGTWSKYKGCYVSNQRFTLSYYMSGKSSYLGSFGNYKNYQTSLYGYSDAYTEEDDDDMEFASYNDYIEKRMNKSKKKSKKKYHRTNWKDEYDNDYNSCYDYEHGYQYNKYDAFDDLYKKLCAENREM